jgi:hypothetical protein
LRFVRPKGGIVLFATGKALIASNLKLLAFSSSLALVTSSVPGSPMPAADQILFSDDFESGDESVIYRDLKAHGFDVTIVPGQGTHGSRGLEVLYVSIYKGSSRVKGFFRLARKTDEASLSYDVAFGEDFQFVKGGKLHGVGPDEVVTGDWKPRPDGWSSRVMWIEDGKTELVLNTQDQPNKWGAYKHNDSFRFERGRFYAVTLYTRLNSGPGEKDGEARVYVDGKLLIRYDHAYFWSDPVNDARISQFLFSTFHGGGTSDWSPKDRNGNYVNVHATFDNFLVTDGLQVRAKPGAAWHPSGLSR